MAAFVSELTGGRKRGEMPDEQKPAQSIAAAKAEGSAAQMVAVRRAEEALE